MNRQQSQQVIIDLTNRSSICTRLLETCSIAVILLSIFLIPKDYFYITVIIISLLLILSIRQQKCLVIDSRRIRYVFRWNLKWENIKSYNLNKANGTLNIQMKDNRLKQIDGISEENYAVILTIMDKWVKI